MEVYHPNSKGHTKVWESITPTGGAKPKPGGPSPQFERPRRSLGIHHPNSRGHNKVWGSITPALGATLKCGSLSTQLKGYQ